MIEMVIAMAILSILMVILFAAFEMGTRVFRDTAVRQSTENQLRSIKLLLERDANHSNIWLCDQVSRQVTVGAETFQRDALTMATVHDWKDPASYNSSMKPIFDRHVVWYATTETPLGKLYRQLVSPPPASIPADGFITPYDLGPAINNDPDLNPDVVYTRIMSEVVLNFQATANFRDGTLRANLRLKAGGDQRPGTLQRTEENLQVEFIFRPKNSWPQI